MMVLLLSIRMSRISFIWKTKKMRTVETFSENQEEASAEKTKSNYGRREWISSPGVTMTDCLVLHLRAEARLGGPKTSQAFSPALPMPHAQLLERGERLEAHKIFARWHAGEVQPPTPIPLLLFTSLRYLGRGLNFIYVAECALLSEEMVCVFFHCFIDYDSVVLYVL